MSNSKETKNSKLKMMVSLGIIIATSLLCIAIMLYYIIDYVKLNSKSSILIDEDTIQFEYNGETVSLNMIPLEEKYYIDEYIDETKIPEIKKLYRTKGIVMPDYKQLGLDYIINVDDYAYFADTEAEINKSLDKYLNDKVTEYEDISIETYKEISEGSAADYWEYQNWFIHNKGHSENYRDTICRVAFLRILAERTTVVENEEYNTYVKDVLASATSYGGKHELAKNVYPNMKTGTPEDEVNYLLYQMADIQYKMNKIQEEIVRLENPIKESDILKLLQREADKEEVTLEEYLENGKYTKEMVRDALVNQRFSDYIKEELEKTR